jgi:hypothetical protein
LIDQFRLRVHIEYRQIAKYLAPSFPFCRHTTDYPQFACASGCFRNFLNDIAASQQQPMSEA